MTDVEPPSTAPSSHRKRRSSHVASLVGAVVTALTTTVVLATVPAGADSLSTARAEASQITAELQADQQHLDVVAQQYDAAQQQVQQLQQQITQIKAAVASDQAQVAKDQANLRQQAVDSYMTGSAETGLSTLFGTGNEQAAVTNEYQSVASGNISDAVDSVTVSQERLGAQQAQLQTTETQAQTALAAAAAARQAAQATVAGQQATLSRVTGEIATLVAQQQAQQQAAEHAAYIARLNSANTVARSNGGHPSFPNLPAAGGAARAVAAAKSQLGVPYVWGGESPGVGFDCSGLTQWSWRQAGVSLPRTAAAQYDAIAHIPLSDLQPGDLLFWAYGGGISHVAMYVGGGEVIQAPETGEVVSYQGIWGSGLVGAGRP